MRLALSLLALAGLLALQPAHAGGKKGTVVELDGLKSTAPAEWKSSKPNNRFRLYQFTVPKTEGDTKDGELVIFFFPDGGGGGVEENLKRWKGMFRPPEGKALDDVAKVDNFKVGKVPVAYLDIHGTYVFKNPPFDPNAKEERRPGYRMLSAYFGSENGPYFIRLTGPAKTVEQQKKPFDDWLKNFQ